MKLTTGRLTHTALLSLLAGIAVSIPLLAAEPAAHDHTHAAGATPPAAVASPTHDVMQRMMALHEKWMSAKTPEERQALMAEHMTAMQEVMKAMQQMNGKSGPMMPMRMDMMTMMMQMMMDEHSMMHMPSPGSSPPPAKQP